MRRIATAAALALLLTVPPALLAGGSAPPGAVPIDLEQCAFLEVEVPAHLEAPDVPADFVMSLGADGLPGVALSGASCDVGTSGARAGPGSFVSLLVRIQRPEDPVLAGEGVDVYFYRLAHYVGEGDLYREVADEAGVDVVPVTDLGVDYDPTFSTMTVQAAGLDLRVVAPATLPTGIGGFAVRWREFHAVPSGYAVLEATLEEAPDGGRTPAVVTASEGSLWARLAGPANAGPLAYYGRAYGIGDGWMGVLPAP